MKGILAQNEIRLTELSAYLHIAFAAGTRKPQRNFRIIICPARARYLKRFSRKNIPPKPAQAMFVSESSAPSLLLVEHSTLINPQSLRKLRPRCSARARLSLQMTFNVAFSLRCQAKRRTRPTEEQKSCTRQGETRQIENRAGSHSEAERC